MRVNPIRHFQLWEGETYENVGGGTFKCLYGIDSDTYVMQNVKSGWTLTAHVITRYQGGKIEWDYSTDGYWREVTQCD